MLTRAETLGPTSLLQREKDRKRGWGTSETEGFGGAGGEDVLVTLGRWPTVGIADELRKGRDDDLGRRGDGGVAKRRIGASRGPGGDAAQPTTNNQLPTTDNEPRPTTPGPDRHPSAQPFAVAAGLESADVSGFTAGALRFSGDASRFSGGASRNCGDALRFSGDVSRKSADASRISGDASDISVDVSLHR